jgi:RNA polymerase sigma factor (TIGR02999 family)
VGEIDSQRDSDELTKVLAEVSHRTRPVGDLVVLMYSELRRMAANAMAAERGDHTLDPTGLVHELLLRWKQSDLRFESRRHFFGAAARAMRQILVDWARQKVADKRTAGAARDDLTDQLPAPTRSPQEILIVSEVIDSLGSLQPLKQEILQLWYFAGLTYAGVAEVLGITESVVARELSFVRRYIAMQLRDMK